MNCIVKISVTLIAVILFFGCKEIVDFDEKSVHDALVVSGIIENGKQVDIRLSKTINRFSDSEFQPMEDLKVLLFQDNNLVGELRHVSRGRYVSDSITAMAGKSYRIEIFDREVKIATAETYVPDAKPILEIDTTSRYSDGKRILQVKLKFADDAASDNFYRVELNDQLFIPHINSSQQVTVRMLTVPGIINSESNWLLRGMGYYQQNEKFHDWAGNRFGIFNDRYINGQEFVLEMEIPYFRTDSVLGTNRKIHFQHISGDYFYYLRSVMQQLSTSNNPFNEPVQIHSNIKGGVGIFGSFSQSVDSIIHINRALIDSLFPDINIPGNLYPINNPSPAFIGGSNLKDF